MYDSVERSARSTFPDLINFRIAKLNGFRRVFAHAAPIFFERGIAKPETKVVFCSMFSSTSSTSSSFLFVFVSS